MTILVTYATRGNSTAEIAQEIGQTLRQQGINVDIRPMTEVRDISAYEAIVAGSAIRQEKWLPEAMQFIETHHHVLRQKPVATFLVCMALATDDPTKYQKAQKQASDWARPVSNLVQPVTEGMFAGVLDASKIRELHFRIAIHLLILLGFFSEGDYRDWDAIRQWTNTLPEQLLGQALVATNSRETITTTI